MKRLIIFILLLPVFAYSYYATSWTASYFMLEEDWKEDIVFTPKDASDPMEIYEIDKFIYAFKYAPLSSVICSLSFLLIVSFVTIWLRKKISYKKRTS
ncbi:DUF4306 domain-containing protein [Robertmurraya kyonggiensis]|uniref:DUF4306 domain-containing protein n=1 Tax=Robertmurraya kyonggiensis TaxID=1037680 RepID=A0A4U1D199_9BACI|nr:DUF4306 domain-containing protein [Robertmurraya kyonggiensis]TKC16095.1 DUF4306 domain-containing protein [Robertmurraya kyonggiensis]